MFCVSPQDVSHLPGVQCDRREPAPVKDVPQPSVYAADVQRDRTCRVPDRRHLLCASKLSTTLLIGTLDQGPSDHVMGVFIFDNGLSAHVMGVFIIEGS